MSKYVKNLITDHMRQRLEGVNDALLVTMVGLEANASNTLRGELQSKNINVMVVKNSLAARAVEGTPLAGMFNGVNGATAVCWGASDIVALAKEVTRLAKDKRYQAFKPAGGLMDGERLSADQVEKVSKWPSREEQLSMLLGQILSPGAKLASQIGGPGGALVSQIKSKGEEEEKAGAEAPEAAPAA